MPVPNNWHTLNDDEREKLHNGSSCSFYSIFLSRRYDEVRWFDLDTVWNEIQHSRERFCVPSEGLNILRRHLMGG